MRFQSEIESKNQIISITMRLTPLYQEGRQQGERIVVENLLRIRFGSLDEELSVIVEPVLALPPEEFTPILMQLSREKLIARIGKQT